MTATLSRRTFLGASGVTLALPLLDAMAPALLGAAAGPAASGRRLVVINASLGLYPDHFFPAKAGRDYADTPYLEVLREFRNDFTVFSGLSHPEVDGGHSAEASFLTAAPHPRQPSFKNTVSMDQVIADKMVGVTRLPYLVLSNSGGMGLSWTRGGVNIPAQGSPAKLFEQLFITGRGDDAKAQKARLARGQSILDRVQEQAKRLQQEVSGADKDKLEEYFSSVRQVEQRLQAAQAWADKPKPTVNVPPFQDVADRNDIIGITRLMFDLIHLVLQTDSSRIITFNILGLGSVPPVPGVTIDHHNLSHHGRDPGKIAQLKLIELEKMRAFRDLLKKLKTANENGPTLLDKTMVLFGSNLGNASGHTTTNLPILLAGGGFRHGQHLAFDTKNNAPLCNLFVTMMRQIGLETERFASSSGTITLG